ncbi:TolC family protein, partial [Salmonella enterica subsp. enterica serovar Napoli]|nr:TolC family protein [Salmonella enterica subsp. enterica serovar Napoli]EHG1420246.1 TolC family protein [Salmonella enterica subsp. enterica serovar Napoli]EHG1433463.1 TolC family protein [Salmonella enterica subsp. enterica serovar Napoli]
MSSIWNCIVNSFCVGTVASLGLVSVGRSSVISGLTDALPVRGRNTAPVRAAEYRLRGANARIGAARAAFFPTISLTGSAGTASASLSGLFEPGSGSWRFLPQITLPLFHGGALRADLDRAHVQKQIEIARYENVIQQAFRDVADGLVGQRTLNDQVQSEQRAVEASQIAYELAGLRFQETTLRCLIP